MKKIPSICELNGFVFCTTQAGHMFSYDLRTMAPSFDVTEIEIDKLAVLRDKLFGIGPNTLYLINPETRSYEKIIDGFNFLSDIKVDEVTDYIYLVNGTEIMKVTIQE